MSRENPRNLSASVRHKLLNLSHQRGEPFEQVAVAYALERMLYRLSLSDNANRFVLKGAAMFRYWLPNIIRPTLDMDFLGIGFYDVNGVVSAFREALSVSVPDDGMIFDVESLKGEMIREGNQYHGVRVSLQSSLTTAILNLQFDVGFGDAVYPKPSLEEFPSLLSLPCGKIAVYSRYSTVAEKFQAMTNLGLRNSRIKDYFDIWTLSRHFPFDGVILRKSIEATFSRRNTPLPSTMPLGLSVEFGEAPDKGAQWKGFLRRIGAESEKLFPEIVADIADFLDPVLFPSDGKLPSVLKWNPKTVRWNDKSASGKAGRIN